MPRLIDANAVIKEIDNYYHNSPFPHPGTTWLRGLELAVGLLLREPTVDAVEVVHGRWEPDLHYHDGQPYKDEWYGYIFKCSACGGAMMGDGDLVCRENYCPNCGAKMDGDGNA